MLRHTAIIGVLLIAASSPALDDTARQETIDSIVEGTLSLEDQYVSPDCSECRLNYADGELPDWNIQYTIERNWRSTYGIRIWSDGQTAICSTIACNEFEVCMALRASPTMLSLLEEQIRRFELPDTVSRVIRPQDECMEQADNLVRIEVGGDQAGFAYSDAPICRLDSEVPDWMSDTVELMNSHLEWINGCQTEE